MRAKDGAGEPPAGGTPAARGLLQLEISAVAAERARADLLVVPVFCDERPLRAAAGRADWRLCGRLSELAARGRLSGRRGEAVLAATFGGLEAPLVLALGLGPRSEFDATGVETFAGDAVRRALSLRVASLALPMPEGTADGAGFGEREERLLFGAADALASRARDQAAELGMILLVREDELARALELVRTSRPLRLPAAVSLRSEPRERPESRTRGARAAATASGARSEPQASGVRAPAQASGARSEPQASGVRAPAQAGGARSEPQASGVPDGRLPAGRPPAQAGGARSEPQTSGVRAPAQAGGAADSVK